ncbi:MAG: hypothetical protein KF773_30505 [Deltaproteobacteria bacterium]|nr:hypothetical protein [Deltaproteobacteria bacterium]MCW5805685.1 hypothetical protein [Deltaproteobacteria bacterium]
MAKRSAARTATKGPHPAQVVAFTELEEAFFRAGDLMSETGEVSGEHTLDEMYAPVRLHHRLLRALDVRTWFRRSPAPIAKPRPVRHHPLSQPIETIAG